jgi:hypothetical protein
MMMNDILVLEMERLFAKHFRDPDCFESTSVQLQSEPRLYATFGNLWRHSAEAEGKPHGRYFTLWGHCENGEVASSDAWYIDQRIADYRAHATLHVLEAERIRNFEQEVVTRSVKRGGLVLKVRTLTPVNAPTELSQLSLLDGR